MTHTTYLVADSECRVQQEATTPLEAAGLYITTGEWPEERPLRFLLCVWEPEEEPQEGHTFHLLWDTDNTITEISPP